MAFTYTVVFHGSGALILPLKGTGIHRHPSSAFFKAGVALVCGGGGEDGLEEQW